MTTLKLNKDVFLLPIAQKVIVYFPLKGAFFEIDANTANKLNRYLCGENIEIDPILEKNLKKIEEISDTPISSSKINLNHVVFLLTQKCNLSCAYCYAHDSHSGESMPLIMIKRVVDYVFKKRGSKKFQFIGGGEPTAEWDLFREAVTYIRNKSKKAIISLTTNCTLLNEERIIWLKSSDVLVSISFDILPSVQNVQRPWNFKNSFRIANQNIHLLAKYNFSFRFRTTITLQSSNKLPQMVNYVGKHYPFVKRIHFEPVSNRTYQDEEFSILCRNFTKYFLKARQISEGYGISISSSLTNSFDRIHERFCNGEFCITPNGNIVACHRISNMNDLNFNYFCYGKVGQNIEIDRLKMSALSKMSSNQLIQCKNCFAKYHCAGGCSYNRLTFSQSQQDIFCSFMKNFLIQDLNIALKGGVYK